MTENLPAHSPLGASSAERWMNCPGSISLLKRLELPESDEPDYRREGIAAHAAAAACLAANEDAWITVGAVYGPMEINVEIAEAIQVYIDTVRPLMRPGVIVHIEERVQFPEHKLGYGTVDLGLYDPAECLLDITDYKNGQGIVVDVEWNPQLMYYAHGLICRYPEARRVRLRIVQPRAFHEFGPVRVWETDAETIEMWVNDELLPAMNRAELDHTLDSGPWCRFCPAKLVCPVLTSLFGAAAKADPKHIVNMSNEALGRSYQHVQAVKFYLKAMEEEAYRLLNLGKSVPGVKLVPKKANRVWKDGGADIAVARFGDDAYTPREIKTPAQIEKIGPDAAAVVKEWAFTPQTGLTVALETDKRPAVKVQSSQEAFGAAASVLTPGAAAK